MVGGGYYRLQMPLKLALAVREPVAGRRLGALEGGGVLSPSSPPPRMPQAYSQSSPFEVPCRRQ